MSDYEYEVHQLICEAREMDALIVQQTTELASLRAALDAAQDEIEKRIEASERDRDQRDQLLALIESQAHLHIDEDGWYSCSQAVDPDPLYEDDHMACLDDTRRGKPCDCGRDAMVAKARAIVGGAS